MTSWVSYLFSGLMAVILSWAVTGCRFGNRIEDAKPKGAPDGISGYYETAPQTVKLCARYTPAVNPTAGPQDKCVDFLPSDLKVSLTDVMSEPVIFQLKKDTTNTGYFYSPWDPSSNPPYFEAQFDSQLKLTISKNLNNVWAKYTDGSAACTDIFWRDATGQITPTTPFKKTFSKSTATIVGSVAMNLTESDVFYGECAGALQYASDCLKDSTTCASANDLATAQAVFGPYLDLVMTKDDVATAEALEMTVTYK